MKKFCPDGLLLITVIVLQGEYLSQNNDRLSFINVEISIYLYKEIAICQRRLRVRKERHKRGKRSASGTIHI